MAPDPSGAGGAALRRCVARPVSEFAEQIWGRAPLFTPAAELDRDFGDLIGPDAVDELVSTRGLRTPFLRMAKDGKVLDRSRFTRGGGAGATVNDQVADDRVLAELADGATLVLQALHRTWPPIVRFAADLAIDLGHPVQVNAYVTPPQNQGFAPHYDVHDVFVLQVAGRKHWTIHEPVVVDPLDDQPWEQHRAAVAARAAEAALIDTDLEPGDTLYLPRGTIHAARALGETSIHLTVGVHPMTRQHLVRHLLTAAQDDPALRSSLPMGVDLSDPAVLAPHLADTVAALIARLGAAEPQTAAEALAAALQRQTRPTPVSPLAQLAAADALTLRTPLRVRSGLRARIDGARIRLLDRTVTVCEDAAEALKVLFAQKACTPADLPGLEDAGRLELARLLIREGVLVPA